MQIIKNTFEEFIDKALFPLLNTACLCEIKNIYVPGEKWHLSNVSVCSEFQLKNQWGLDKKPDSRQVGEKADRLIACQHFYRQTSNKGCLSVVRAFSSPNVSNKMKNFREMLHLFDVVDQTHLSKKNSAKVKQASVHRTFKILTLIIIPVMEK